MLSTLKISPRRTRTNMAAGSRGLLSWFLTRIRGANVSFNVFFNLKILILLNSS